jgi:hypothetical protein
MSERFDPKSYDSMFARILAEMQADRDARSDFRRDVLARFDKGAERMDQLDAKIEAVHLETKKTNGRVTQIEMTDKVRVAKIAGATAVAGLVISGLLWLYEQGLVK